MRSLCALLIKANCGKLRRRTRGSASGSRQSLKLWGRANRGRLSCIQAGLTQLRNQSRPPNTYSESSGLRSAVDHPRAVEGQSFSTSTRSSAARRRALHSRGLPLASRAFGSARIATVAVLLPLAVPIAAGASPRTPELWSLRGLAASQPRAGVAHAYDATQCAANPHRRASAALTLRYTQPEGPVRLRLRQRQSSWRVHRRSAVRHRRDARYGRADWRPCRDRYLRHGQRRAASLFSWWLPKPARGRSGHPMVPRRCARAAGHDGAAVEQGRSAGRGTDQAKFAKLEAVGCPRAHDAIRTVLRFADTSEDSILLGSLESKRIHYGRAVARGK